MASSASMQTRGASQRILTFCSVLSGDESTPSPVPIVRAIRSLLLSVPLLLLLRLLILRRGAGARPGGGAQVS